MVLEAAAQVFDREGLTATTNRIAERAGVSIGSLYQYFPDKHALLYALAQRHVSDANARLRPVFARLRDQAPPFEDAMRDIVDVLVDLHRDRPALHRLMHRLAPRMPAELYALREFEDHIADEIAHHLTRCGRGGDDAALTAQTVLHAVDAHLHRVLTRREVTAEPLVELILRLVPPVEL